MGGDYCDYSRDVDQPQLPILIFRLVPVAQFLKIRHAISLLGALRAQAEEAPRASAAGFSLFNRAPSCFREATQNAIARDDADARHWKTPAEVGHA
jgi:hypothetical protein